MAHLHIFEQTWYGTVSEYPVDPDAPSAPCTYIFEFENSVCVHAEPLPHADQSGETLFETVSLF